MRIFSSFEPINTKDINDIQTALEVKLPDEYVDFLLTKHAFAIYTSWFKVNDRDLFFSNFLPYCHEENKAHLVDFNLQVMSGFEGYIMIARGYSHDAYLIKVTNPQYGYIYYLRLDNTMEEAGLLIADSFSGFCKILDKHECYNGPDE